MFIKSHTLQEIAEKGGSFKEMDALHGIERDSNDNVISSELLLGKTCHYVDKIEGRRHMVAPVDDGKCAIVSKGKFTGIYDLALYNLLYNISITGRTGKGYHEVMLDRDVVLALDGVIPHIKELYLPLFKNDRLRRTAFHTDVYQLMTGDIFGSKEYIVHHGVEGKEFRTFNTLANLSKVLNWEHTSQHMLKYHNKKRRLTALSPVTM